MAQGGAGGVIKGVYLFNRQKQRVSPIKRQLNLLKLVSSPSSHFGVFSLSASKFPETQV